MLANADSVDRKALSYLAVGVALGVLATSAIFAWLGRGAGDGATRTLKLSHALDQAHPVHAAMEYMAERLEEKSGGALRLAIYPNGQLGSETESIEQVQRGVLAMVKTSVAPLEGFVPEMGVFGLPYLFKDEDSYWEVLNGPIGEELRLKGIHLGLRGLIYYESGSRSFYTIDKPILEPGDLAGQKIRTLNSKMAMDMISQLGGSPTPIPWGELYTALQQGMVDGAENNPPSYETSRHYEVAKHYSLDEHTRIPDLVLVSQIVWETLSAQEQRWVQEAADESVVFQRDLWREKTQESMEILKGHGVTVYHPDKGPFREKVQPMYERFEGTPIGVFVERILEAQ